MKYYYNYRYRYGSFHSVSKDTFYWIQNQPYVKEESITDRIIYDLNRDNPFVFCHEFRRNEEAVNGADWEWWILFNDCEKVSSDSYGLGQYDGVLALRCRIQAKKLARGKDDNYHLFQYANRNGLQIDLLRKQAAEEKAFAIYALYSDSVRTNEDITLAFCNEAMNNICTNCRNGIFLISADKIYMDYIIPGKEVIYREDIVNKSLPASILDFFISEVHHYYYDMDDHKKNNGRDLMKVREAKRIIGEAVRLMNFEQENIHMYKDFPEYLKTLILHRDNKRKAIEKREQTICLDQFQYNENKNLSGVGIIDMCRKNELVSNSNGERFFKKK